MTRKEKLATEYIELRKKFDGPDFQENVRSNQVWHLIKEFRACDLEDKIKAVEHAIADKELRLKREAYFETPEGKAYKENLEAKITANITEYREICENFQNWVISEVNNMVPGNWTVRCSFGYNNGNITIGLVNRNPKNNYEMQFGHDFTIYYEPYTYKSNEPRFELNYGTLGSFDLFNDETRSVYLNGLATISNNKEWLKNLMNKFAENIKKVNALQKLRDELRYQLDNPEI